LRPWRSRLGFDGQLLGALVRKFQYVLRPPIAQERVVQGPDGLVRIVLKKRFSDGTFAVDLDQLSLLTRSVSRWVDDALRETPETRAAALDGAALSWQRREVTYVPSSARGDVFKRRSGSMSDRRSASAARSELRTASAIPDVDQV
jgi:hypothetical protein